MIRKAFQFIRNEQHLLSTGVVLLSNYCSHTGLTAYYYCRDIAIYEVQHDFIFFIEHEVQFNLSVLFSIYRSLLSVSEVYQCLSIQLSQCDISLLHAYSTSSCSLCGTM